MLWISISREILTFTFPYGPQLWRPSRMALFTMLHRPLEGLSALYCAPLPSATHDRTRIE